MTIVLLAIFGAVIAAVIGTLWYMPSTPMGRIHMRYVGFDKLSPEEQKRKMEESKPQMFGMYAGQMLLSFLTSLAVVFIVIMSMRNGVSTSLAFGFILVNWLCFMVPIIGSGIIWGNVDRAIAWKKFLSDAASNLLTVLVIAIIASFFA